MHNLKLNWIFSNPHRGKTRHLNSNIHIKPSLTFGKAHLQVVEKSKAFSSHQKTFCLKSSWVFDLSSCQKRSSSIKFVGFSAQTQVFGRS